MPNKLSSEDRAIIESILKSTGYSQEDINNLSDDDLMIAMGEGEEVTLEAMDCSEEQLEILIEYAKLIRATALEEIIRKVLPKIFIIEWRDIFGKSHFQETQDINYCRRMVNMLKSSGFRADYYEKSTHYVVPGKEIPLQSVYLNERMSRKNGGKS